MNEKIGRLKVLTAGICSLILTLGIARFAYTPLLPLMQKQSSLGISQGGWLASINYMGYLTGAVIASFISDLVLKDRLYRLGLIMAVVTTAAMGFTENLWLWSALRYVSGLSSAAGLLLGSGLILNWLMRHNHRSELGIHFSGLGLGIAFCALVVELMTSHYLWDQQWYLLALMGIVFFIPAWIWLPSPKNAATPHKDSTMGDNPPSPLFLRILMASYFCAGVGYVVSATFIVAIVDQLPGLEGKGSWTFLILGLAAAPACIIWDLIARKFGNLNALFLAFLLQAIGILMPVIQPNLPMTMIGAALFGGTFIGLVSLVLTMAGRYFPTRPAKMMGKMTISYGVAQILAPFVTGILAERSGNYSDGLYIAAFMIGVGALLILLLKVIEKSENPI